MLSSTSKTSEITMRRVHDGAWYIVPNPVWLFIAIRKPNRRSHVNFSPFPKQILASSERGAGRTSSSPRPASPCSPPSTWSSPSQCRGRPSSRSTAGSLDKLYVMDIMTHFCIARFTLCKTVINTPAASRNPIITSLWSRLRRFTYIIAFHILVWMPLYYLSPCVSVRVERSYLSR